MKLNKIEVHTWRGLVEKVTVNDKEVEFTEKRIGEKIEWIKQN